MHIENISRKLFSIVKDLDWLTIACSESHQVKAYLLIRSKKN